MARFVAFAVNPVRQKADGVCLMLLLDGLQRKTHRQIHRRNILGQLANRNLVHPVAAIAAMVFRLTLPGFQLAAWRLFAPPRHIGQRHIVQQHQARARVQRFWPALAGFPLRFAR